MDSLSWSDGCLHFFRSCFSCLAFKSRNNDVDASGSYLYEGLRSRGHNDFESLLRDPIDSEPDADTMSLHSNIGDAARIGRKRTKARTKRRGMNLFGINVFGRSPLQLPVSEDEDDFPAPIEHYRRKRTSSSNQSSSTLDSDAAPLRPEDIARLTSAPLAQLDAIKQDRSERRRRRHERELAARALAMSANSGEFEGFQGSGGGELFSSSHLSEQGPSTHAHAFSPSSLYGQAARLFEAYVQSATSGLPSASSSDEQGEYGIVDDAPDFDADNYSRSTAGSKSSASGSGSHSHTSPSQTSYEHIHDSQYVYNHHYLTHSQLSPQTPRFFPTQNQPQASPYFPAENGDRRLNLTPARPKKSRNKSGSSRKSSSSSSQSPSIASPSPIHPAFTPLTTIRVEDNEPPSFDLVDHAHNVDDNSVNKLSKGST